MVWDKVFYDGYVIVVVVVVSVFIVNEVFKLIEVEYEILLYVIDVEVVMKEDVFLFYEDMFMFGVEFVLIKLLNVVVWMEFGLGDFEKGFVEVDVIVECMF